jgi:hypothetical protein
LNYLVMIIKADLIISAHTEINMETNYSIEQLQSQGTRCMRHTDSCSPRDIHSLNISSHFFVQSVLLDL